MERKPVDSDVWVDIHFKIAPFSYLGIPIVSSIRKLFLQNFKHRLLAEPFKRLMQSKYIKQGMTEQGQTKLNRI